MNKGMEAAPADWIPTHGCCDCCVPTALAELLGWHQDRGSTTEAWNWLWGQSCWGFESDPTHAHRVWQELSAPPCVFWTIRLGEDVS